MAMFDYGKDSSGQKYMYQYLTPDLQSGFYPVDNLVGKYEYGGAKPSEAYGDDVPAYGEVHYSSPLSASQVSSYGFSKIMKSLAVEDKTVEPAMESAQKESDVPFDMSGMENEAPTTVASKVSKTEQIPQAQTTEPEVPQNGEPIVLHDVRPNRLFTSKDGKFRILSMLDNRSDTGYSNYVVKALDVKENPDKTLEVYLGNAGQVRNLSIKRNGEQVMLREPIEAIEQRYKDTLFTAAKSQEHAKAGKENPRNNAFLNFVDTKFVYDTKNPNCKVVSIPYGGSENGYAKVTVPTNNIFDTKVNGKTVPNHVNVNLGPSDNDIPLSIKKNGTFTRIFMKASDVADMQKSAVERWKSQTMHTNDELLDEKQESVETELSLA